MATITPASVIYTPLGGNRQVLNFDAVLAEDHMSKATITKFPVQEGFHVTNHSIRDNRVVSIRGSISNVKFNIPDQEPKTNYGTNATAYVKSEMEALIQSGLECRVTTNLGDYNPVVFSSFKTTQKDGFIDSMEFTLVGEEIIKANAVSFSVPTPIIFTESTGPAREVLVEELAEVDIFVSDCDKISTGSYEKGQDFILYDVNAAGESVTTTYEYVGLDPSTGSEMYEVHVSESAVATHNPPSARKAKEDPCAEKGFEDSLLGGISQVADCLLNEATDIGLGIVEDTIDTAMGSLVKSSRGLLYDAVEFAGGQNSAGGMLTSADISCIVRGATGNTDVGTFNPGESLPTTAQIMEGASQGLGFTDPPPEIVTLTQIQCACTDQKQREVDESLVPLPVG